jgi:hypothetical protein
MDVLPKLATRRRVVSDASRATSSSTSRPAGRVLPASKSQKNHIIAVVATARKLVVTAHLMLKNREPYRCAVPATTRDKLAGLRVAATGVQRRKSGPLHEPMQSQPEGIRVHKTPALNEVYSDEGLPAAKSLSELGVGETKILTEMKVLEHASNVQIRKQRFCHTQKTG